MLSSKQSHVQQRSGGGGLLLSDEEKCEALPKGRSTVDMRRALFFVCILCVLPLVACLALTRLTISDRATPVTTPQQQSVTWSRAGRDVSSTLSVTRANYSTEITDSTRVVLTAEDRSTTVVRTSPSPSVTTTQTSIPTPTKSVHQNVYFVNDTLLGTPVPCTDAEKECLRFNRLLFPADGKCYPLGDGPSRCHFAVDRCDFESRSRHIRGTCVPTDLCPSTPTKQVRLAFDGRCVKLRQLRHFCGKGAVDLVPHFFGDFECAPVTAGVALEDAAYVPQPPERGRCVFPNLRHDLTSVLEQEKRLFGLVANCSEEQSSCFARNQVWCGDLHRCCDLLRRNHCADDGHWVTLNRSAWEGREAVASSCVPRNPCGGERRLMAFDGRCHQESEVLRALCPNGVLLPNAFGEMACVTRDFYKHVIELKSVRPGLCEVSHKLSHDDDDDEIDGARVRLTPECGLTGFENCVDAF